MRQALLRHQAKPDANRTFSVPVAGQGTVVQARKSDPAVTHEISNFMCTGTCPVMVCSHCVFLGEKSNGIICISLNNSTSIKPPQPATSEG
jgi:hypothetical protein